MEDKLYHVISNDGLHEYDILVTQTDVGHDFSLYRSANTIWVNPSSLIMTISENEHNGTVKMPKLKRKVELFVVEELGILSRFVSMYDQKDHINELTFNIIEANSGYRV